MIDLILILQQPPEVGHADRVPHIAHKVLQFPHILAGRRVVERSQTAKVLFVDISLRVEQEFDHFIAIGDGFVGGSIESPINGQASVFVMRVGVGASTK